MTRYVALLRAVNVAGRSVAMSDLRELLAGLGLDDPRTLLQSGNLVFGSDARSGAALEETLEVEAGRRLGLQTDFLVRSATEWQAVIEGNPFRAQAKDDPSHLVVMPLKDAPRAADVKALQAAISGPEIVRAGGKHLYITYPAGIGRSRLTNAAIEKRLGTRGTARNWNTVLKIAALLAG